MTIAVVDDSKFMRGLIVKALTALHPKARIIEFADPTEALRQLPALAPDLITLDLLMPGLHGLEVLEKLSHTPLRSRIVVITADVQRSVRQKCTDAGVHAFVEKPVTLEKLRAALADAAPP